MKRTVPVFAAVMAMLASILMLASPAVADQNAPIALAGCATNTLGAGDDVVEMASLGFIANIGDDLSGVDTIYVSENGIVSFDGPIEYWYNGFDLRDVASWFDDMELVAPLYADSVRDDGGSVTYGQTTYQGRAAFCVEWNDMTPWVPDFVSVTEPLPTNSFQLILVERNDRAEDDFDVIVNYESIGWDDTYCEEQFFGEFERAIDVAADDAEFNNCGCDFELQEECFGIGIAADTFVGPEADVFPDFQSVGALAGVAFPQGFSGQTVEFAGSGFKGEMVDDANGLAFKSLNSLQDGRFVVEIRNGFQDADLGSMDGFVLTAADELPIAGSLVSGCNIDNDGPLTCVTTRTDDNGFYEFGGAPIGQYLITAYAPPGTDLITETELFNLTSIFGTRTIPTFELEGPQPPADNVTFSPIRNSGSGVTVYWNDDLDLTVTGCVGGTATWIVTASEGPSPLTGSLTEGPDGTYAGVVPSLFPTHGTASLAITIVCPDGSEEDTDFSLYIDPAGVVVEIHSGEPIDGATVVLERRGQGEIEFTQVPDGSEIMDENNRVNPWTTDATGLFSWNTIPGQYRVSASAPDCDAISLPAEWADRVLTDVAAYADAPAASSTPILQVEPEWLDLILAVDCNNPPTIDDPGPATFEAPAGAADLTDPTIDDLDPTDQLTLTNDAPADFPLGDTDVTWTVSDGEESASVVQTITVEDTTAPEFVDPPSEFTFEVNGVDGWTPDVSIADQLAAVDSYDPSPSIDCADTGVVANDGLGVTIECVTNDASGNGTAISIDVFATDTTAPQLTLPDDVVIVATNSAGAVVIFRAAASDIGDGDVTVDCFPAAGDLFPVGTTTVDCTAVDSSGNGAGGSFDVTVVDDSDTVAPVISVPADITVPADSADGAVVDYDASATDEVDGEVAVTCAPASGSLFPVGTTTVTCDAADASGNDATETFDVTVEEYIAPADDLRSRLDAIEVALDDIDGLNNFERARVRRAIQRLQVADQDRFWDDGDNLRDRGGYFAMNTLRRAVLNLSRVDDPAVEAQRDELLAVMRQLAQNRLDEAIADDGFGIYIYWSQWRLDRGDQLDAAGRESSAAWNYKGAWLLASWAS